MHRADAVIKRLTPRSDIGSLRIFTMRKPPKSSAQESSRSLLVERLTNAVNRLADEVRVVRDVLDETREDLGWLTRNGVPHQPTVHTQVVRMARDPLSPDWNERLEFRRFTSAEPAFPQIASEQFDELVAEIAEIVTGTGQEQVNLLLGTLDDMRAKLAAAIKSSADQPQPEVAPVAIPPSSRGPARQGELF